MIECDDPEGTRVEILVMLNKRRSSAPITMDVRCANSLPAKAPEHTQTFFF
jgi:hypothetical protein